MAMEQRYPRAVWSARRLAEQERRPPPPGRSRVSAPARGANRAAAHRRTSNQTPAAPAPAAIAHHAEAKYRPMCAAESPAARAAAIRVSNAAQSVVAALRKEPWARQAARPA